MSGVLEPDFETWEEALADESVDAVLDEVESDSDRYEPSGVCVVLPAAERSAEKEKEFSGKLTGRIKDRLSEYQSMSKWDIYKGSFSRGKFARAVVPLLTGYVFCLLDSAVRTLEAYDAKYTYALCGAYLFFLGVFEGGYFYGALNENTSKMAALAGALQDSSVAYVDTVKLA